MTCEQHYWWRIALELKLRKCSGDAFQDFFSTLMSKLHGSSYVRVRAFGKRGDKGCDGYLQPIGQVFQCYGALNADRGKVSYLIKKMSADFETASSKIASIMKEWHMVHNLVDGLPVEAIEKLEELRNADPSRKLGFIGLEGFEERIFSLDQEHIEALLGPAATNKDAQDLQASELRQLVTSIADAAEALPFDVASIRPVPAGKLDFNKLPGHWRMLISGGWQNTHLVSHYLRQHQNPLTGEIVAQTFRTRYQYLKAQNLAPGSIMSSLYEMVIGNGYVAPARQVAAQALLAYLFESCDIFEGEPSEVEA
jgi:hypothetical protein